MAHGKCEWNAQKNEERKTQQERHSKEDSAAGGSGGVAEERLRGGSREHSKEPRNSPSNSYLVRLPFRAAEGRADWGA